MATRLTKPVRRKLDGIDRNGIILSIYPNQTIGLRPFRCRTEYVVQVSRVYKLACEVKAEADRRAKEAKKADARKAKGLPPLVRSVKRGLLTV